MITIYHNPRCSKSREAIKFLDEKKVPYKIVEYLKQTPDKNALKTLLNKLHCKPIDVVRKNEELFKTHFKNKNFTDEEWIDIIVQHPILLERPIVEKNYKALIARPTEKIVELL
ncbi:MAG: arsenate reductase (glutaredoxin) [Bacteroidetes bacterium]|nr:arsenate reductase (glutaredoxin) [Bacteroidota bacterium]MBV6460238.1 putative protein YfgD [Flavobacteriales bacterium]WKZ74606.1 MAG: arsenate reductase (glutaredoxin) [Vicingaceae bacterium]MCL4816850.1 arsenate reductase (glutaredoxin) [Flavobacteriales bacterium]NOG94913.1 arsenate reductase (glutaredoxin) [Bacteroidota bacterium]